MTSWLMSLGTVLLCRFVSSNTNTHMDRFELKEANPTNAHVHFRDGRESTVSLRDLAPCPVNRVDVAQNPEDCACNCLLQLTLDVSPIDSDADTNEIMIPNASTETTIPNATTETTVPNATTETTVLPTAFPDSHCSPAF